MRPEERRAAEHACARLIARYANLNDAADWHALTALYAPDGRMNRPTSPDDWIEGASAILAAFEARPARRARHICSNVVVDVLNAKEAVAWSAMALFQPDEPPKLGSYHDRFVQIGGEWKFAERRGSLSF